MTSDSYRWLSSSHTVHTITAVWVPPHLLTDTVSCMQYNVNLRILAKIDAVINTDNQMYKEHVHACC